MSNMATIKAIEGRSVHQIQSGQVIVDLQSVCKELVENSIDAGATSVEVRFKNYGLDAIEVQDNGSGIAPDDYETIALKHYTSKLATYDDLALLQTFGFRGEALSSLCALSNFHIVTARASDGSKGTRLDFEQSGKLKATSVVAAKQGTTVVVETLFHNLPVRRKELEKNIKREYNKVLQLLNAYACISVGVKFSVSNQIPKGKKTIAFSTNANTSTRDNISNVYGAKTIAALVPLALEFAMDPSNRPGATQTARNWSTQEDPGSRTVKIVGHISRPVVGEGRQTPDRQMFFVNSRPCTLPQVAKAFNEVYKSYNVTQSPFIFADIQLDTNAYDVNVSPDKRTIMLHDQTALLENLKNSLIELFEGQDQSMPQSQLLGKKTPTSAFKPPTMQRRDSEERVVRPLPRSKVESNRENDQTTEERMCHPKGLQRSASFEESDTTESPLPRPQSPLFEPEEIKNVPVRLPQPPRIVQDFNARIASQNSHQLQPVRLPASPQDTADVESEEQPIPAISQTPQKSLSQSTIQNAFDRMRPMRTAVQQATITELDTKSISDAEEELQADPESSDDEYMDDTEKKAREEAKIVQLITEAEEAAAQPTEMNVKRMKNMFKIMQKKYWTINLERVIETDAESISRDIHELQKAIDTSPANTTDKSMLPSSAQLHDADPEERLSLTVTKSDFHDMRIVGQFNQGFIIAVRPPTSTAPTSDLFIIDQHASDEKYNFERLAATTVLVSQRLVHPHPLELSAVEKEIILANEHALLANGFVIETTDADEETPNPNNTTTTAHLTSLPMSKEITFSPTDLEELLALILDNPPSSSTSTSPYIPRPTKVRKLLASRACRSSVMIE
ncbi:DNA mismatch repair protein PMS1 [Pyrenophora tritici-repentis Pt-1C-BFP]|uniref:DNA mismatch repair protein PMS1 n=1 Tax=Pyrenophora tritici-repentis (strain Pt-1C-BFP) TaxID=426418 RepID=B2W5M0_PYRTR|nr:DNA mismatch repair protein PMS1 [Pyrenophora tritici-repentis Pt-1C-BFP]EDU47827.1 DNA mismatch repair protein PMS1 [Pyrenophora tritici-repentis Pt-1C-BFP]